MSACDPKRTCGAPDNSTRSWSMMPREVGGHMPKRSYQPGQRDTELIEKLVVLQLYNLGAAQDHIAKVVGLQKLWVNNILKGLPKKGEMHGKGKKKKAR